MTASTAAPATSSASCALDEDNRWGCRHISQRTSHHSIHHLKMKTYLVCFLLGVACGLGIRGVYPAPSNHALAHAAPPPDLLALMQDFWHWKTQDFPQFATQVGINDNTAGRLDSLNNEHFEERRSKCEEFLQRSEAIEADSLSEDDLINLKILKEELKTYIDNFNYLKYFTPITFLGGPQLRFKQMVEKEMVLESYNDYQKLLSRYGEFPRQAQEILDLMKGNLESGLMPSNWSMVGVIQQLDDLGGPVEDSVFYRPFVHTPATISREQRSALREQAEKRIQQDLLPSFKKIRDFIQEEYLAGTRNEIGVSSLEGGEEFYQACLKFHTSTQLTPQEIHNLGISEVARITEEVAKTAIDLGMEGKSLGEISRIAKSDPSQNFNSKEELLDTYRTAVYSKIYPVIHTLFAEIPDINVTVEGKDNPNAIYASYSDPSMDGTRPGTFYLNTYIYDQHKKYEVMALSLHETIPGHHLHSTYMRMNPSTPDFRKYVDFSGKEEIPAKFPLHTAFLEGWGLYSEYLGQELGLYEDPYQRLGRHSFELLRASRLVVDTGIHALGWSRAQAKEYLLENTAMTEEAINIQVNRYITWPGQACSYKIGEIKIKQLRQKAENVLGKLFNIKAFHSVVLHCAGPLKLLEECVNNYIETASVIEPEEEEEEENGEEALGANGEGGDSAPGGGSGGEGEDSDSETSGGGALSAHTAHGGVLLHSVILTVSIVYPVVTYLYR
ncbi:LOW QUALITY PROTEIN: uncharacterized protein [Macrobrachium rosenbergii]|uniref:LOW QUALITY PROTEIN: uncharacterized protein n=1 Tax=Macrobrachium rosenbergii TaxID=79674 RepID=UPI0034D3D03F